MIIKELFKELIDKYTSRSKNKITEDNNYENIYVSEIKLMVNFKLRCTIVKYNQNKYIIIEPRKLVKNVSEWKNWDNFKFPIEILKDNKIKKMINKMNRS